MPYVRGFLNIVSPGHPDNSLPGGGGQVDPGYGVEEGRPGHELPPGIWGGSGSLPPHVDNSLPPPPPGIWPKPVSIWPPTPLPPNYPMPPGSIWPPVGSPSHPIAPGSPGAPDNTLPTPPGGSAGQLPSGGRPPTAGQLPSGGGGHVDNSLPSQKYLVAIVSVSAGGGLKVVGYTVVDPSLSPGQLPVPPPTAQPK
jgi:hypothetical protein